LNRHVLKNVTENARRYIIFPIFTSNFSYIYRNLDSKTRAAHKLLHNFLGVAAWIKKVIVKYTLVQALRLCTGRTAHRGSRGIALLFHDQRN